MESQLPPIPVKRYFTIGEVGELCGVKPHVLRYWEQEFTQLRPIKRRGNRRYYQHHEVLMIRRIRELLYDQGFTIHGARVKLHEIAQHERDQLRAGEVMLTGVEVLEADETTPAGLGDNRAFDEYPPEQMRLIERELKEIRDLLTVSQWLDAAVPPCQPKIVEMSPFAQSKSIPWGTDHEMHARKPPSREGRSPGGSS
jgi:DNA-binding transcriptional MerR regulator